MRKFIIDHHSNKTMRDGEHAGLILQRYLAECATGEEGNPQGKQALLQEAIRAASNNEVLEFYSAAFDRWAKALPKGSVSQDLQTQSRLIVGLGEDNILEAGIRLHHLYGMPILPGSALKGLASHYCDQVWGSQDDRFKKGNPYHQLLFGVTDDRGCIAFHDSWLSSDSKNPLHLDVVTPHHPLWIDGTVTPTDFDTPIPSFFLSVVGKFRVVISWFGPQSDQEQKWKELAFSLLLEALRNWGIGGKTSSGYGRLDLPPPPKKRDSGDPAKVVILETRSKGFNVQDVEPSRNKGTLTVGSPPLGTNVHIGAVVDVLVHNDEQKNPQYKWPKPSKK